MSGGVVDMEAKRAAREAEPAGLRTIAFASGKRGAGTTTVTANIAVALGAAGRRVCALDVHGGLAKLDAALGLRPQRRLDQVLSGEASLADVIVDGPAGIRVVPGARGVGVSGSPAMLDRLRLLAEVDSLAGTLDVLLVDVGCGVGANALWYAAAAAETCVVITPDTAGLQATATFVTALAARHARPDVLVLVNDVADAAEGDAVYREFLMCLRDACQVRLERVGVIPRDADAAQVAGRDARPMVLAAPDAPASVALSEAAARLVGRPQGRTHGGAQFLFDQLLEEWRG